MDLAGIGLSPNQALEPMPYSLSSFLAPAFGSSSYLAFGVKNCV